MEVFYSLIGCYFSSDIAPFGIPGKQNKSRFTSYLFSKQNEVFGTNKSFSDKLPEEEDHFRQRKLHHPISIRFESLLLPLYSTSDNQRVLG